MGRVIANGPEDLGSIPRHVILKTLKTVLDTSLLNTERYKYVSRVKWSNPGKGKAPSPTPWCCSYWKGSFRVTPDYGHQLYLSFIFFTILALLIIITIIINIIIIIINIS